jgi:deoxyribose-phosphate aldolase
MYEKPLFVNIKSLDLRPYIEHTVLYPTVSDREVDAAVATAKKHGFAGVCVPPFWVKRASRDVRESPVRLVTVAGFPFGYQMTETKLEEIKLALRDGAHEVDMVINLSALLIGFTWVKIELARAAEMCHAQEAMLKVIIETAYLKEEDLLRACRWCAEAGVDYVKTSTGYAPEGASIAVVQKLRKLLPSSVGIKASGGIRTRAFAEDLIAAGADRLGTSVGDQLVAE